MVTVTFGAALSTEFTTRNSRKNGGFYIIYHKHGEFTMSTWFLLQFLLGKWLKCCLHNLACSNKHEFKPNRIWYGVVSRAVRAKIFFFDKTTWRGGMSPEPSLGLVVLAYQNALFCIYQRWCSFPKNWEMGMGLVLLWCLHYGVNRFTLVKPYMGK